MEHAEKSSSAITNVVGNSFETMSRVNQAAAKEMGRILHSNLDRQQLMAEIEKFNEVFGAGQVLKPIPVGETAEAVLIANYSEDGKTVFISLLSKGGF
ncbi:MAG: hypothetical protein PHS53_00795 [Candidatus Pacebacteria bacterium]|nr:hypothetical protein [Candidatus Paceibacterota bacterium]MDD5356674.1 hypothetical protein [Candidatus Paceibacterota bacterium]